MIGEQFHQCLPVSLTVWFIHESSLRFNPQNEGSSGIFCLFTIEYSEISISQMLHVWYIYLQNWVVFGANVGKYSSTMEHVGSFGYISHIFSCQKLLFNMFPPHPHKVRGLCKLLKSMNFSIIVM